MLPIRRTQKNAAVSRSHPMDCRTHLRNVLPPGNPAWELAVQSRRTDRYSRYAVARGTTTEAYTVQLREKIHAFVVGADVRIRVPSLKLTSILRDGRLKTLFETSASGGASDPAARAQTEAVLMGLGTDVDVERRPVYGYLVGSDEGVLLQYGSVILRLKEEVRRRTTFTLGDSLDDTLRGTEATLSPCPLDAPTEAAAHTDHDILDAVGIAGMTRYGYVETQIHGGVSIADDVEEVVFLHGGTPDEEQRALLESSGIQWETVQGEQP
jgi:hypothetical protein